MKEKILAKGVFFGVCGQIGHTGEEEKEALYIFWGVGHALRKGRRRP